MKIIVLKFVIIIFLLLPFSYCGDTPTNVELCNEGNEVGLQTLAPNIGGNWSAFTGMNTSNISLGETTHPTNTFNPFRPITFDTMGRPVPSSLVNQAKFVLNSHNSNFQYTYRVNLGIGNQTSSISILQLSETESGSVANCRFHTFKSTINPDNTPVLSVSINTANEDKVIPNGYVYESQAEFLETSNFSKEQSINIAVFAEGYRADQIENTLPFNYKFLALQMITNTIPTDKYEFNNKEPFLRYRSQLRFNIIRIDSISPEAGIDSAHNVDDLKSILNMKLGSENTSPSTDRVKEILKKSKSNISDFEFKDFDAFVVFVNGHRGGYAYVGGGNPSDRNGEPSNYIMLQTPMSSTSIGDMFIGALGHELGHAIGAVWDEYLCHDFTDRNISTNITPNPWQDYIDAGYCSILPSGDQLPGCTTSYNPSPFCAMHTDGDDFCPVCHFWLYHSIEKRIGNGEKSKDDFKLAWPPSGSPFNC